MDFKELAAKRYSVRKFLDKPVDKEKLDLILAAAQNAPTAHNRQPQRILVIDQAAGLAKVDIVTRCRFGAPLVFMICYDKTEVSIRKYDQENSGWVDASIVTTQMMFQAEDIGLGTTWVMHFDPAKVREQFQLPEQLFPVAFLPTGYPAADAAPSELHFQRHPLDKLVYYGSIAQYP
ncbi:nitroreductase [Spirochaetia bacterium]|nr:nitroreductase [Spirochaetia bacterium]